MKFAFVCSTDRIKNRSVKQADFSDLNTKKKQLEKISHLSQNHFFVLK